MSYPKKNKLDPFRGRILEWVAEGKEQKEILSLLKLDGCSCSASSLSDYLKRERKLQLEEDILGNIATGREMLRKLDAAYQVNPEPAITELIRVSKTLILSLQMEGTKNPDLLPMATTMQQMVLNYLSGETKAKLEAQKLAQGERKLAILEAKAKQADAAKGLLEDKALSEEQRAARMREVFGMGS